ncbi:ubiquitin-conjugating enzyme E2 R1 isoform X1 [Balaenoptera ricei]|uniref:ubiquitin-conjugating enzyme E2 R1 isoform X1 n=1 Tax=Balaenoptera ricei TaxID=2746895 RepID=UPI0028BD94AD|nr:ubiquitin-conjugating enzyme E2 R1 isoform X1 [Balaenoptera ricei]
MARPLVPSSQKALLLELKGLQEEPVEGFRVTLVDEGDLYNWEVAIFGPPNTYYEGGYFKARLKFPIDYPYSPPAFRFLTKMWHPNIYEDHPPERHLPPQRTQHLLTGQRGRFRDVQEVERKQRQGPRIHGHYPVSGPGAWGGRAAPPEPSSSCRKSWGLSLVKPVVHMCTVVYGRATCVCMSHVRGVWEHAPHTEINTLVPARI